MTDDLHTDEHPPVDAQLDAPDDEAGVSTAEPASEAEPRPPRRLGIVFGVALAVLISDQLTKWWAVNYLVRGTPVEVIGTLQWNLYDNTGVAFSLGSDNAIGPWVSLLAIGVVVGVSFGATSRIPLGAVASGLISGGAIGNLLDRAFRGDEGFLHGAVVDFIDLQFWPVFNIADAAIVVGAILLVIASFRAPE